MGTTIALAEIHFHDNALGKGPYNGVGANIKHSTIRATQQWASIKAITVLKRLFDRFIPSLLGTTNYYYNRHEISQYRILLKNHLVSAFNKHHTQKFHDFIPITKARSTRYILAYKFVCSVEKRLR